MIHFVKRMFSSLRIGDFFRKLVLYICASAPIHAADSPAELFRFNGKDLAGFYTWLVDAKRDFG